MCFDLFASEVGAQRLIIAGATKCRLCFMWGYYTDVPLTDLTAHVESIEG